MRGVGGNRVIELGVFMDFCERVMELKDYYQWEDVVIEILLSKELPAV